MAGRSFLRPLATGQRFVLDPATLSWQLKLDARSIVGLNNGDPVTDWPDSSGFGRDAVTSLGLNPIYRPQGSSRGRPVVEFGVGHDLHGGLPAAPIDVTAGLSMVCYILEDTVDANDGGGANAQEVLGCHSGTDMRLYAVIYPSANSPQVGGRTSAVGDQGSGTPATIGAHTLAVVCNPPSGATGVVRAYKDGFDCGGWLNWTCQPNTEYWLSGNPVVNICIKGKLAFCGFTSFALTPAQVRGLHNFFRGIWG